MRKEPIAFALTFLILFLNSVVAQNQYTTSQEYYNSIDYSCETDSDCIVKDIHNCCGYYPACTNKNAIVDANFVRVSCRDQELSGACGFPEITSCACINNKCSSSQNQEKCYIDFCFSATNCQERPNLEVPCSDPRCNKGPCTSSSTCGNGICEEGETGGPSCPIRTDVGNCPQDCLQTPKNNSFNLSNGRNAEIKIMPETASQTAIEQLGDLSFTIQLKEVGQDDNTKVAYELSGKKDSKFLGIIKNQAQVKVYIDAETGQVISIKRPWWSFLASGI